MQNHPQVREEGLLSSCGRSQASVRGSAGPPCGEGGTQVGNEGCDRGGGGSPAWSRGTWRVGGSVSAGPGWGSGKLAPGCDQGACGWGLCPPGTLVPSLNPPSSTLRAVMPLCIPHLGTDHCRAFQAKDTAHAKSPRLDRGRGGHYHSLTSLSLPPCELRGAEARTQGQQSILAHSRPEGKSVAEIDE